jgi:hypothetical protein
VTTTQTETDHETGAVLAQVTSGSASHVALKTASKSTGLNTLVRAAGGTALLAIALLAGAGFIRLRRRSH